MDQTVAAAEEHHGKDMVERWNYGLRLSIANAALFFFLSLAAYLLEIRDITYPTIIESIFALGSLYCFIVLIRSEGELAIIGYFVLSCGFYFGLGTIYSTTLVSYQFNTLFSTDDQWLLLNKINLINALSILTLLCVAWPLSKRTQRAAASEFSIAQIASLVSPLRRPLFFLSIPVVVILALGSFPEPENPAWRTTFLLMDAIGYSAILLCGMEWSRISLFEKSTTFIVMIAMSAVGLLTLSKAATLLPIISLTGGLMLNNRVSARLIVGAAIFMIVSFLVLAVLVNGSRGNFATLPQNTMRERITILQGTISTSVTAVEGSAEGGGEVLQIALGVLNRFGDAGIQAFIVQRYDSGKPSNSLHNAWQILVPRFLWPGKPDISAYGLELEAQITNVKIQTWLGPTFMGEAYWNGGWLYVVLVSIMMGLEIGWFTRKWNKFREEGVRHIGILIFAVPVMIVYLPVESWITLTYVGQAGFAALLVLAGDIAGPMVVELIRPKSQLAPAP